MQSSSIIERIVYISDVFFNGNRTALAKAVGLSPSTLNRLIKDNDKKNLSKHCAAILAAMPDISKDWLLHGHGAPLENTENATSKFARNKKGKHIGELLDVALGFYDITPEEVEAFAGISRRELDDVLIGRKKPDFEFMENLYIAFGINPAYLFHCDERVMREARGAIDRAFHAIGKFSRYPVASYQLEEVFGASEDDAREYAEAYRKWKADLRSYAQSDKPLDPDSIPESPDYPFEWMLNFAQQVTLNLDWLDNFGSSPFRLKTRSEIQKELDQSQNESLRKRICELETLLSTIPSQLESAVNLQKELFSAQNEVVRLQKELAEIKAQRADHGFSCRVGELVKETGAANGVQGNGKN